MIVSFSVGTSTGIFDGSFTRDGFITAADTPKRSRQACRRHYLVKCLKRQNLTFSRPLAFFHVNYPLSKANGLPASQTSFLRSTPVGAEQTSTGCFTPYYLHRR